jgi:hypothetical protein
LAPRLCAVANRHECQRFPPTWRGPSTGWPLVKPPHHSPRRWAEVSSIADAQAGPSSLPLEPCECEGAVEEFAELAGLAAAVAGAGSREPALEILAMACAALREAVEAAGVGAAPLPAADVVPIFELAGAVGAEGLYAMASTAVRVAAGDEDARPAAERIASALGVPEPSNLSNAELAAAILGYIAAAARAEEAGIAGRGS